MRSDCGVKQESDSFHMTGPQHLIENRLVKKVQKEKGRGLLKNTKVSDVYVKHLQGNNSIT